MKIAFLSTWSFLHTGLTDSSLNADQWSTYETLGTLENSVRKTH